jgi:hypothetical protein
MTSKNRTIGSKDVALLMERIERDAADDFLAAITDKRPLGDFLNSMATYTGASRAAKEICQCANRLALCANSCQ